MLINIKIKSISLMIFINSCYAYAIASENYSSHPFVVGIDSQGNDDSMTTLKIADATVISPQALITSAFVVKGYEMTRLFVDTDCGQSSNSGSKRPEVVNIIYSENEKDNYAILILDTKLSIEPIQMVKQEKEIDTRQCYYLKLNSECHQRSSRNAVGLYPAIYSSESINTGLLNTKVKENDQAMINFVSLLSSSEDFQSPIKFDGSPLVCKCKNDNKYGLVGIGSFGVANNEDRSFLNFEGLVIDTVPYVDRIIDQIEESI